MSVENNKVCCNCRHNIRSEDQDGVIICTCEITGKRMGYVWVMEGWCRHWSKEKEVKK